MAPFTVLVWNMALGSRPQRNPTTNWARLSELMDERSIDIALLNEASVPIPSEFKARYERRGTRGRDRLKDGRPVPRPWATAVVSMHHRPEGVRARAVGTHGRRPDIPFKPSRAGSWTAGVVKTPGGDRVTCVALYGLLEELSDASVHRSLSDVSPIFSDPEYNSLVLVGGDLNTSTAWPDHRPRVRDQNVLERMEAYGLVDCLRLRRPPGRLKNCRCVFGQDCQHTWTRLDPNQKTRIKTPHQMDYLFASIPLARRLKTCEAFPPLAWKVYSDHSPIIATFD